MPNMLRGTPKATTPLQNKLDKPSLCRRAVELYERLSLVDINLNQELNRILQDFNGKDLTILDAGCGSGTTIEDFVRLLQSTYPNMARLIKGIGVDSNPLPEFIPDEVTHGYKNLSDSLISDLRAGDVCDLPVEDESVDLGFSIATLIYVDDVLKALEEGHRVLKDGGVFYWEVYLPCLTETPPLEQIVRDFQGIFKFHGAAMNPAAGILECRRNSEFSFSGFNYRFIEAKKNCNGVPRNKIEFCTRAVYERVESVMGEISLESKSV